MIGLGRNSVSSSSLLLLTLSSGLVGIGDSGGGSLVLLGDGEALAVLGEAEESLSALTADETIGVLSHVGSGRALGALLLELLDLAGGLNGEVVEEGLCALLVLVGDSLGGRVHLLLALTLTSLSVDHGGHGGLSGEASLLEGKLLSELGSTSDETVNGVLSGLLNLRSKKLW